MVSRISRMTVVITALAALSLGPVVLAQEHPKGKEHPEHPAGKVKSGLTKEELADAITNYVKAEAAKSGGVFKVDDTVEKTQLELTLSKVHKDRLTQVAPHTYFLCADFSAADAHMYDLDIFMKGPDKDHLTVTEVSVHKKDGEPRYTWYEEGGLWKKQTQDPAPKPSKP